MESIRQRPPAKLVHDGFYWVLISDRATLLLKTISECHKFLDQCENCFLSISPFQVNPNIFLPPNWNAASHRTFWAFPLLFLHSPTLTSCVQPNNWSVKTGWHLRSPVSAFIGSIFQHWLVVPAHFTASLWWTHELRCINRIINGSISRNLNISHFAGCE